MIKVAFKCLMVALVIIFFSTNCKARLTNMNGDTDVLFSPDRKIADVAAYTVCCGSVRGFLLDSSAANSLDIWIKGRFRETFVPIRLPIDGNEYEDISKQCQSRITFDQSNKSLSFWTKGKITGQIKFSKSSRDMVYGVLANQKREKAVIIMEIGEGTDDESKIYFVSRFRESFNCE